MLQRGDDVVGEVAHVAVAAGARNATIQAPGGAKLTAPIVTGSVAFSPERAGFFQLHAEAGARDSPADARGRPVRGPRPIPWPVPSLT